MGGVCDREKLLTLWQPSGKGSVSPYTLQRYVPDCLLLPRSPTYKFTHPLMWTQPRTEFCTHKPLGDIQDPNDNMPVLGWGLTYKIGSKDHAVNGEPYDN